MRRRTVDRCNVGVRQANVEIAKDRTAPLRKRRQPRHEQRLRGCEDHKDDE
jgi:hypothetical protein